jgi:hypothetical protein
VQAQFCSLCGAPIPRGSVFCPMCGSRLPAAAVQQNSAIAPAPQSDFLRPLEPTPPPPIPAESIRWFPNNQRLRMLRWVKAACLVLGIGILVEVVGATLLPGGLRFGNGWVFAAGFTSCMYGAILLATGASSYRREPIHFGVSDSGVHRDVTRVTRWSPGFVSWSDMTSIRGGVGPNGQFVSIKTAENRPLSFLTTHEGAEAAIAGYERWRSQGGFGQAGTESSLTMVSPSASTVQPTISVSAKESGWTVPDASWKPNSLRRTVGLLGVLMVVFGVILLAIFVPGVASRNGGQAVVFAGLPLFVGILLLAFQPRYPDAVAVSKLGFSVRRRGSVQSVLFKDIVALSSVGLLLECETTHGRTIGIDSLGARETKAIQDAYVEFRGGPSHGSAPVLSRGPTTWSKNPAAWAAAAGFWGPISLLIASVVVVASLILWNPGTYGSLAPIPALAALPSAFCVMTFGIWRRAPAAVGFTPEMLQVRYAHHFYPASALVQVRWTDVTELGDRPDLLRSQNSGSLALGSSPTRYLTFRTQYGLTYTLGPISSEIQHRIIRSVPVTLAVPRPSRP